MSERPGIILYFDTMEPILHFLPNDSLGALVRAAILYAQTGEVPDIGEDKILCFAWESLRQKLDRDDAAYKDRCEKNRANARKRWDEQENPPNATASDGMQSHAVDAKRNGNGNGTPTPASTPTPIGDADGRGVGEETAPTSPLLMGNARNYYQKMIDGHPSPSSMAKLDNFEKMMGTEVCIMAIDAAIDVGKKSWAYINAILASKQEKGVRSRADWEWEEAKHIDRKKTEGTSNPFQEMLNDMKDNRGDIIIAEQVDGNG